MGRRPGPGISDRDEPARRVAADCGRVAEGVRHRGQAAAAVVAETGRGSGRIRLSDHLGVVVDHVQGSVAQGVGVGGEAVLVGEPDVQVAVGA